MATKMKTQQLSMSLLLSLLLAMQQPGHNTSSPGLIKQPCPRSVLDAFLRLLRCFNRNDEFTDFE